MQQIGAGTDFSPLAPRAPAPLSSARRTRSSFAPNRRKQPQTLGRRALRILLAGMALFGGLSGGVAYNVLNGGTSSVLARLPELPGLDGLVSTVGLGLDEVSLSGHRFTSDLDVFDALDLANARSFLRFDSIAARERIERLPWVATAEITRIYPGRLEVRIAERAPYALWRRGTRYQLIDRSGRVLSAVKPDDYAQLPRVAGEGAPAETAAFLDLVGRHPVLKARLTEAERIGERRWTLHLTGNVVIHLPADREALALEEIAAPDRFEAIAGGSDRVVDLRSSRRITTRATPAVPAATASISGGS